jgi:hypothetical protein
VSGHRRVNALSSALQVRWRSFTALRAQEGEVKNLAVVPRVGYYTEDELRYARMVRAGFTTRSRAVVLRRMSVSSFKP